MSAATAAALETVFAAPAELYRGLARNDLRNTDNAWVELRVAHTPAAAAAALAALPLRGRAFSGAEVPYQPARRNGKQGERHNHPAKNKKNLGFLPAGCVGAA